MAKGQPSRRPKGDKATEQLLRAAEAAGARVEFGGRHYKVFMPGGKGIVVVSATTSDHRSLKNARAQMRRFGLDV
jgi:hypothetical protein